jgi:hypothetical protein
MIATEEERLARAATTWQQDGRPPSSNSVLARISISTSYILSSKTWYVAMEGGLFHSRHECTLTTQPSILFRNSVSPDRDLHKWNLNTFLPLMHACSWERKYIVFVN